MLWLKASKRLSVAAEKTPLREGVTVNCHSPCVDKPTCNAETLAIIFRAVGSGPISDRLLVASSLEVAIFERGNAIILPQAKIYDFCNSIQNRSSAG